MRRRLVVAAAAALLLAMTVASGLWRPQWWGGMAGRYWHELRWRLQSDRGYRDSSGRSEVPCSTLRDEGTAVLLTMGQSNAANEGELAYTAGAGVFNFNFFDGRCYLGRDPLLGTTGASGGPWTRLADKLIAAGRYSQVLVVPIAVGGSPIRRWAAGGDLHSRIPRTQQALAKAGLTVTHVLWHQGESDARRTSQEDYLAGFASVHAGIRAAGIEAPVYVAVASVCGHPGGEAVRAAQRDIPRLFDNVRPGPDTDQLDERWRLDGCHFNAAGLDRHAQLWFDVLVE